MIYGAIDLGGTNIRVAFIDSDLKILDSVREPSIKGNKEALLLQIVRLLKTLKGKHPEFDVKYVGISAAGFFENGIIKLSPNLFIKDFDLISGLKMAFPDLSFRAANDANCSALIEALEGAGKPFSSVYFITVSTGIGVGLVIDKKLVDLPFETGHSYLGYKGGYYGLEDLCSGTGIVRLASMNHVNFASAKDFFDLVRNKVADVLPVYRDWISLLASSIANAQLAFNTEVTVLSGGVMKSKDVFLDDLGKRVNEFLKLYPVRPVRFVEGRFLQDTGLYGGLAEALALEKEDK